MRVHGATAGSICAHANVSSKGRESVLVVVLVGSENRTGLTFGKKKRRKNRNRILKIFLRKRAREKLVTDNGCLDRNF
jgi:hypothetical protein